MDDAHIHAALAKVKYEPMEHISRSDWKPGRKRPEGYHAFIDGGFNQSIRLGSGAALLGSSSATILASNCSHSYEAETLGLLALLQLIESRSDELHEISIWTDSASLIRGMERWGSQKLTELQYTTVQTLARVMSLDVHITMRWIPSHKEADFPNDWRITGNAKVDALATQAMLNPVPDMNLPFSTTHIRQLVKKAQKSKKNKETTSTTGPNHLQLSQEDKKEESQENSAVQSCGIGSG